MLGVLAAVALAAAAEGSACAPPSDPAVAAARAVAEGIVAADNRRDLAAVLASYAPDAVLLPPNEAPVVGIDAIRPRYEGLFHDFAPAIEPRLDEICVSGSTALIRGRNGGRLVPRQGGTPRRLDDVYVMGLRRAENRWRITHLMWHPASRPETAALAAAPSSPEPLPDGRVTFRLAAPSAQVVELELEGKAVPMTKAGALWSVTTDPLEPDIYGYHFLVDGVALTDPGNPEYYPNLLSRNSAVLVPGTPPRDWEVQNVPHGTLHRHTYRSAAAGDIREYFVYTPPGYGAQDNGRLPVLYLLHGFSDDASGWSAVGRAHVILDNLIASKRAVPMIVVMPLGYGTMDIVRDSGLRDIALRRRSYSLFLRTLIDEVVPAVESAYRTSTSASDRAVAGLSMGGFESLLAGLRHPELFAWVGAFSTGGLDDDFTADLQLPAPPTTAPDRRLLYLACGTDDRLIGINRRLHAWLDDRKLRHEYRETAGAHAWPVWRRNFIEFASRLFR